MLQKLGIKQRFGRVYNPQGQSVVERVNGVLKNKLLKICMGTGLNWVYALPLALMAYRSSAHRDLKITPHEALTGRPMPSPVHKTTKGPSLDVLTNDMKSYVKQMTNIHRSISARFISLQAEVEREDGPLSVRPGDLVYVKVFRRKWNIPRREGPYEVARATPTAAQFLCADLRMKAATPDSLALAKRGTVKANPRPTPDTGLGGPQGEKTPSQQRCVHRDSSSCGKEVSGVPKRRGGFEASRGPKAPTPHTLPQPSPKPP
ncbi:uncharacterized protein LOC133647926 [Entelurus aequoreus]|uniref:uncharacterized protein LOC133647926 n=1 Tax=Entelurus aequoreus TaxID=161455 RepID=UPI002B1D66A4|nr:uncharacterized protein LOC133647926 [Entelurus aequoreus]